MSHKTGRNEPCPCGSGRKYKHCCLIRRQSGETVGAGRRLKVSLRMEIEKILAAARQGKQKIYQLGVFLLFADAGGDAWLLEVTDCDAVQLARAGKPLDPVIDENPDTIEIDWSHTFVIRDRRLYLSAYEDGRDGPERTDAPQPSSDDRSGKPVSPADRFADKRETCLENAPVQQINAAIRRTLKKYSPGLLSQVHVKHYP